MRAMMLILYAIDIDNRSIKTGENDFIKCGVLSTASSIVKIDDMFHSWRTLFLHRIYLSYQIAKNILEQLLHNNCSTSTHRQNEMKIFSPSQSQSLFLIFRPKLVPSAWAPATKAILSSRWHWRMSTFIVCQRNMCGWRLVLHHSFIPCLPAQRHNNYLIDGSSFKCKSIEFIPFSHYASYQVKAGTKIANVIAHAKKVIAAGETRALLWSGYGNGVVKTISCVEVMKREHQLHQLIKLCRLKWVAPSWILIDSQGN